MDLSLRNYINIIAPYMPPQLLASERLGEISRLAATLPPSSNFGFECRLGSASSAADLLLAVIPSDGSLWAWAQRRVEGVPAPEGWASVQRFLSDWHGGDPGFRAVYDTWLEFDLEEPAGESLVPSFFFGFDHKQGENHPDVTEHLLAYLRDAPLTDGHRAALRRCYGALPPGAQIFQVGLMLSRPVQAVRLCVRGLAFSNIAAYLKGLRWSGAADVLRSHIEPLIPFIDNVGVDLDVTNTVLPRIGLECSISDGPTGRAKVGALLGQLVSQGHCTEEKMRAIGDWLGYCSERTDRGSWPAHLLKASERLGPGVASAFARTLNHIKLSYEPDGTVTAKAYLGVRHYWVRVKAEVTA